MSQPDPEKDSAAVQDFFSKMEAAFMAHPLWSGCSEDELDSTGDVSIINVLLFLSGSLASSCLNHLPLLMYTQGLEKYVMTKLFSRVFASNTEGMLYLMRNSFRRCLWFNSSFLLNIFVDFCGTNLEVASFKKKLDRL